MFTVIQQVLDLDGLIVSQVRNFPVEGLAKLCSVADAVEEIGIAEGDVLSAGFDLVADICENDFGLDDAKATLVDRYYRAMATEMLAAPAGFRVANGASGAFWKLECGVACQFRKIGSSGHSKVQLIQGDEGRLSNFRTVRPLQKLPVKLYKPFFELTRQDEVHAVPA